MRSLYNPFSPLRFLDLWSVAAFGGEDSGGGGGGGSDDSDSSPNAGMSMADQYASYGAGNIAPAPEVSDYEQAAFGGSQEDYYNDQAVSVPTFDFGDDDDDPAPVTYTNPRIGYESGQDVLTSSPDYLTGADGSGANTVGQVDDSFYGGIPTTAEINAASGFFDDDEDYTPTSAELNEQLAANNQVNLTDDRYAEPVDYNQIGVGFAQTGSGDDYRTAAQADTDVSGAEYVANIDPVTGVNTTDTLASDEPAVVAPVTLAPDPVYTDSAGVEHSTQAAADAANAQYAETARLAEETRLAEENRIQALINQVVAQDSAQDSAENITSAPVADDSDLDIVTEPFISTGQNARDQFGNAVFYDQTVPQFPKDQFGNVVLDDGPEDDGRYDFVDDLPDDRFDFVDETEALLAELGIDSGLLSGGTDSGIDLESSRYDFVDDLPDDALDFVETPVTDLQKVQDLVDSGVDRSLAQAVVESGGTPGEAAGIDKYDFGFDGGIKGTETAPSVVTELALGTDDEDYTPTSAELEAQLAEQGLTNITPGPLSVEDQIAQYDTGDGLTDYEREVFGTDTASFYNNLANTETGTQTSIPTEAEINAFRDQEAILAGMSGGAGPVTSTDTGGAATSTSGTTDATGSESYLSAVTKISDPNYDPNESTLTNAEQYALYGARGQTPNAAETAYLNDLLSDATHKEDGPLGTNGKPIYSAGDKVTVQSFGEKVEDGIVNFVDMFLNPLSIFGEKFTIGGANAAKVEAQLEAYKNGGTFVYNNDGAVVGVASPNFDASGDGNLDTVVLYDESGNKTVTGDGIALIDAIDSNKFTGTDGEKFDIDIVNSVKTYTNPDEAGGDVVEEFVGAVEDQGDDDDDDFIICEEGFEFDPVEGICMPIAGVGDSTGSPTLADRPVRDRTDPVVVKPDTPEVSGLKIRGAKQFAQGGMVTSNIDNFVQSLRG